MSESQEHGGRWGGSQRTRTTFRAVECANMRSAARNTLGQPASPLVGPVCARVTLGQPTSPDNWTRILGFPVGVPMVLKRFAFICVKTQLIFVGRNQKTYFGLSRVESCIFGANAQRRFWSCPKNAPPPVGPHPSRRPFTF